MAQEIKNMNHKVPKDDSSVSQKKEIDDISHHMKPAAIKLSRGNSVRLSLFLESE